MDYLKKLQHHYRPRKGWVNDPNGLVYYKGYYHLFYQHSPDCELPFKDQPMHWGHARTSDFITWEELPVALFPDMEYDNGGCWSGTAIVKDDILYLFYASVHTPEGTDENIQTVSIATSRDGINFEKYDGNPVIDNYPSDGGHDFRDPAVCCIDGKYYCVMATGHPETKEGRLLLYRSEDLFDWQYEGIMSSWDRCKFTECPSLVHAGDKYLLTASICPLDSVHYFHIMYGSFEDGKFKIQNEAEVDKGPDQYAGQVFTDHMGRNILISWIPGWRYKGYAERDIGCFSVPREIKIENGIITAYPVVELRHLLKEEDEAVKRTEKGFIIERMGREPVVYEGEFSSIEIIRDEYIVEVYIDGGREIYTALL
ncbi:MAG: glycoside hydrolase family 32 protein [Clostridia bacterium]|nr:glycoside hydrolase family 32 protein [Clostridia bacterium]